MVAERRLLTTPATRVCYGAGAFFLPRVGWEVLVHFYDGDPDRPLCLGRVANLLTPFPYDLPDAATIASIRSVSSPGAGTYNEFAFDDAERSDLLRLHAGRDVQRSTSAEWNTKISGSTEVERILGRWVDAQQDGDEQFSEEGINAVRMLLQRFEVEAAAAAGAEAELLRVLANVVGDLETLGGSVGQYGCSIETDEREELVRYLIGVVREHCLKLEAGEDPTESYRQW